MIIGVYSPDGRYDAEYVGNYANLYVLDAIKRIPGANQASILGTPDLAMRILAEARSDGQPQHHAERHRSGGRDAKPAVWCWQRRPLANQWSGSHDLSSGD